MKRRVVPPISTKSFVNANEPDQNNLPLVFNRPLSNNDDKFIQDNVTVTLHTVKDKSTRPNRARVTKRAKHSTSYTTSKSREKSMIDDIILSGEVIVKKKPDPKLFENSFAAAITSVKPPRRVVNMIPQRTLPQGLQKNFNTKSSECVI